MKELTCSSPNTRKWCSSLISESAHPAEWTNTFMNTWNEGMTSHTTDQYLRKAACSQSQDDEQTDDHSVLSDNNDGNSPDRSHDARHIGKPGPHPWGQGQTCCQMPKGHQKLQKLLKFINSSPHYLQGTITEPSNSGGLILGKAWFPQL